MGEKCVLISATIGSLILAVLILLGAFLATYNYEQLEDGNSSSDSLDYDSAAFQEWCENATVQASISLEETVFFGVTGSCRKTRDMDGSWSFNCRLIAGTLPDPTIKIIPGSSGRTCKATPTAPDTYSLAFSFQKAPAQVQRSSLTHFSSSLGFGTSASVHPSNETVISLVRRQPVQLRVQRDTDTAPKADPESQELNQEFPEASAEAGNWTVQATNIVAEAEPAWDRSKCFKILPECAF